MASRARIAADWRRQRTVERHAARRVALKQAVRSGDPDQVRAAVRALQRLPRDASPVRLHHRDQIDGRPLGYLRHFGVSRITLRSLADRGELPGVTTSSW